MRVIENEKRVVGMMINMYCRHKEGNSELCKECSQLLEYSMQRLEHCRFGESKPSCRKCAVHCYRPDMRQRMREVMRWAGPRMMLYHPLDAIMHLIREMRN